MNWTILFYTIKFREASKGSYFPQINCSLIDLSVLHGEIEFYRLYMVADLLLHLCVPSFNLNYREMFDHSLGNKQQPAVGEMVLTNGPLISATEDSQMVKWSDDSASWMSLLAMTPLLWVTDISMTRCYKNEGETNGDWNSDRRKIIWIKCIKNLVSHSSTPNIWRF